MINILLLNNTENYHAGCRQVIKFFKDHFSKENMIVYDKKNKILPDFNSFDLIILNGEGSIHDDAKKMISYLEYMNNASANGVITMLVNTVWHNNSKTTTRLLEDIDYVSVREIKSKNEIQNVIDKNVDVYLDLSFYVEVSEINISKSKIVSGNKFLPKKQREKFENIGETSHIDIFQDDWNEIVNKLRSSEILVTGRHHEMYAACKARCKFIVLEGNTHKNSGLLKTFDCNIPYLETTATNDEIKKAINEISLYEDEYTKLFDTMEQEVSPNFLHIYEKVRKK